MGVKIILNRQNIWQQKKSVFLRLRSRIFTSLFALLFMSLFTFQCSVQITGDDISLDVSTASDTCGDNIVDFFEQCDPGGGIGATVDTLTCNKECTVNVCGDGHKNDAETCDDGNTTDETECPYGQATCPNQYCNSTCSAFLVLAGRFCGDLVVDPEEYCDLGVGAADTAVCDSGDCTAVVCNDGYSNVIAEDCEDGNTTPGDGCDASCKTEACDSYFTLEDTTFGSTYGLAPTTYGDAGASGLSFAGQSNDDSGAIYNISNMCSGTYYVWVNGFDIGVSTSDTSYGFWDYNSGVDNIGNADWFYTDTFAWQRSNDVNGVALTRGNHTWRIGSMPDGGNFTSGWDQIVITQNPFYTPPAGVSTPPVFYDSSETFTGWAVNYAPLFGSANCPNPPVGDSCIVLTGGGLHKGMSKATPPNPTYVSYWAMSTDASKNDAYVVIGDPLGSAATASAVFMYFNNAGNISFLGAGSVSQPYTINTWYFFEIKNINYVAFTYDIYIDGVFKGNIGFRNNINPWQQINIYNASADSTSYYDEFIMY